MYSTSPNSWTADISTGVTTAYVSAKDRSNISFMAFEADDGLIHFDVNGKTTDGAVTTDKPETTVPETKAPAETGTGTVTEKPTEVPEDKKHRGVLGIL